MLKRIFIVLIKEKGKIMSKLFLFLSLLFFLTGCEQLNNVGGINNSQKYRSKVGNEWEYNTTWKLEFYDSIGNIDSTSFEDLGNTVVRIITEEYTLGLFKDLIMFESFDLSTIHNVNQTWYLNADSGLFAIAYSNPGATQPVFTKTKYDNYPTA